MATLNDDDEGLADWRAAAHHEAGHAVAAIVLGGTLRSVSIAGLRGRDWDWSGETQTWEEEEATGDEVIRLLAGPMAEAQFCGNPGIELPREACRREIEQARAMAIDIEGSYDRLKSEAVGLVSRCWAAILALAARFEATNQIDGVVATEVIKARLP